MKNNQSKTIQMVFYTLIEVIELYPQYTIAQHLSYILKDKKGFMMNNTELLNTIENYKLKLESETHEEDEYF